MKKNLICFIALMLTAIPWATISRAHDGVTPSQVITDMKHNQQGPYAAPILRGRNLSQDWLGFTGEDYNTNDVAGILIREVKPDGPADSGDMEKGDVIIEANGQSIGTLADLDDIMATIKGSSEVEFTLLRNGKQVSESVYVLATLREIAPEMADIMQGETKPQPGMMMEGMIAKNSLITNAVGQGGLKPGMMMDSMIAKSPLVASAADQEGLKPGMFMEEMMQRSPMGRIQEHESSGQIILKRQNPLDNFLSAIISKIPRYKNHRQELDISDEKLESLHKLQLNYRKQLIKTDADFKIMKMELEEALRGDDIDFDKLEGATKELVELKEKRQKQALNFLKEYYSLIDKEQRKKLKQLSLFP